MRFNGNEQPGAEMQPYTVEVERTQVLRLTVRAVSMEDAISRAVYQMAYENPQPDTVITKTVTVTFCGEGEA